MVVTNGKLRDMGSRYGLPTLRTTAEKTPDGKHYIVNGTKYVLFPINRFMLGIY